MVKNTAERSEELRIGLRSLLFAAMILLILITATGMVTRIIPSGQFERYIDTDGYERVVEGSFTYVETKDLPVYRWYTASIEVLFGPDAAMVITIIVFMCLISGAVNVMNRGGILEHAVVRIVGSFGSHRHQMEALLILVFMLFGSILGSMEEVVVLIPLLVRMSRDMGWDDLTGLGLSLGAIAFGFASAMFNPFTLGVAQRIAGIPIFSGVGFRFIVFLVIYGIYTTYVIRYSRRIERGVTVTPAFREATGERQRQLNRGLSWFTVTIIAMVLAILVLSNIPFLSSLVLPAVILFFLIGGLGSGALAGLKLRELLKAFSTGITNVAAGSVLVLMAASIKLITSEAGIMDTILFRASSLISTSGPYAAVLGIYLLVLLLNFFISSGSAKAFLIMPIIAPLADMVGLSRQSAILAFIFGDGFSNILYPTNALLLICLAITGVRYGAWFRWIIRIELVIFIVTIIFLLTAVSLGY